ncbi:MAG TPA: hypothetical protein VMW67_07215 [Desulfobacteria bacterium]|nr:hypothetical protein [Desulfobacteria bacterium]
MRGFRELLVGFALVAISFVGIWYLVDEVLAVLLGVMPLVLLFFGALFVMMGVSSMRMKSAEPEGWSAESGDEGRE